MLPGDESDRRPEEARDGIGADGHAGPRESIRRERRVRYTHEISAESSEVLSRTLIRLVPLTYGIMLGVLSDHFWFGLSAGLVFSAVFDVYMGSHSMVRFAFRGILKVTCPTVAMVVGRLVSLIGFVGLPVPAVFRELHCEKGRGSL